MLIKKIINKNKPQTRLDFLNELRSLEASRFKKFQYFKSCFTKFENWTSLVNYINIKFYEIFSDFTRIDKMFLIVLLLVYCHDMFKKIEDMAGKYASAGFSLSFFDIFTRFFEYYEARDVNATKLFEHFNYYLNQLNLSPIDKLFLIETMKLESLHELEGSNIAKLNEFFKFFPYYYLFIRVYFGDDFNSFLNSFYMAVDRKGKHPDRGTVMTPLEIIEIIKQVLGYLFIDEKNAYIFDPLAGCGSFALNFKGCPMYLNDFNRSMLITLLGNLILNCELHKIQETTTVHFKNFLNFSEVETNERINEHYCSPLRFVSFLNPPYEEEFKPGDIIEKVGKITEMRKGLMVLIVPSVKMVMHSDQLSFLDNYEIFRIKLQSNIFKDSGVMPNDACYYDQINGKDAEHKKGIYIRFYNFSNFMKPNNGEPVPAYDFTDSGLETIKGRKGWAIGEKFEEKKKELYNWVINIVNNLKHENNRTVTTGEQ